MSEHTAEKDAAVAKWQEAGWKSPDDILNAYTELLLRVRAAVAEAQEMDRRGPGQFKTGQDHLPPAFREVDFRAAFQALARIFNKVEEAVGLAAPGEGGGR